MNDNTLLPADLPDALLVGRVWRPDPAGGPSVVVVRAGEVIDITATAPTVSDLLDHPDRVAVAREAKGESLGDARALMAATLQGADGPRLLAPCDLQPVKAAGVTFAISLLERLIEEEAGGGNPRADAGADRLGSVPAAPGIARSHPPESRNDRAGPVVAISGSGHWPRR